MMPSRESTATFPARVRKLVEENLENERFGVSELASLLGMSRSSLHRRIKSEAGISASRFIRDIRLGKALEMLHQTDLTAAEVAYRTGFGSPSYFSKCFHDHYGYSPGGVKENGNAGNAGNGKVFKPDRRRVFRIVGAFMLVVAVLVMILTLYKGNNEQKVKVLAILPLHNDSPLSGNEYIVNGLMEELLDQLSKMEGLFVISRTTMEAYRDSEKSMKEIGEEVGADYIIEGSATIVEDQSRIRLQLIDAAQDRHLWAKPYESEIDIGNLFRVQEEIAHEVSLEMGRLINPDRELPTGGKSTDIPDAYTKYLRARELIRISDYMTGYQRIKKMGEVRELLMEAVSLDTAFTDALAWLAHTYIDEEYFFKNYGIRDWKKAHIALDSGMYFVEKALKLDPEHCFANGLKANSLSLQGRYEEAEKYFSLSLDVLPEYQRYSSRMQRNSKYKKYSRAMENYVSFRKSIPDEVQIPAYIRSTLYMIFLHTGFFDEALQTSLIRYELSKDYWTHHWMVGDVYLSKGDYRAYRDNVMIHWNKGGGQMATFNMLRAYIYMGELDSARIWMDRALESKLPARDHDRVIQLAYMFVHDSRVDSPMEYLDQVLEDIRASADYPTEQNWDGTDFMNLARVYSILGDSEKTMEALARLEGLPGVPARLLADLKNWPSFDLVRDEPEFKKLLSELEERNRKEHEKIARIMERNPEVFAELGISAAEDLP